MDVLIIEDEGLLARRLKSMLEEMDNRIVIREILSSVKGTVDWLSNHPQPDCIFMDIELADGQCFDIFRKTEIRVPVIFTTAYDEYALKAFKVNTVDYLLKPVTREELKKAWDKFLRLHRQNNPDQIRERIEGLIKSLSNEVNSKYRDRFLVKKGPHLIPVEVSDLAYVTIRNGVCLLVDRHKTRFPVDYTLDEIEAMLDPKDFFRVNRQFILPHDCIVSVQPWFNSKLRIETRIPADEDIIVSRERSASFKEWLGA